MIIAPVEIGVVTKNIDKLCEFYARTFGLKEVSNIHVSDMPEFALSATPYHVIRLQFPYGERIKLLKSECTETREAMPTRNILSKQNLNFITIIVKNLEITREAVTLNGGVLLEKPVELRKGMRISFAADPEGNLIELTEYNPISDYRTDLQKRA